METISFIEFAITALFITNCWILVYNALLQFLNISFPAEVQNIFIRVGAVPEPFEIPLYLLATCTTLFFLFIFRHSKYLQKLNIYIKSAILFFLILLFVQNIGSYPMAHSVYPYTIIESNATYVWFFLVYSILCIFFVGLSFLFQKKVSSKNKFLFFFFLSVVGIIALVTFEPGFPIVGHDYSFFLGPMWEVVHGKTLYAQVPSQYGFLSVLFLSVIYKLGIFSPYYLSALVWILYIVEYSVCFYLFYRVSNFLPLAVTGALSLLTINYFSIYHLPASIAQTGPLRWLPLVLSLFVFYKVKDITSNRLIGFIALAAFWVIDSGMSLLMAYCFTLLLLFITKNLTFKKSVSAFGKLLAFLATYFLAINIFHFIFRMDTISIFSVFAKIREYAAAGFGMIPMDSKTYFWVVVLLYLSSLLFFFQKKTYDWTLQLLLFAANISFFAGVYFVGRSHPHNLFHTALFPILNAFILFGLVVRHMNHIKQKIITIMLLVSLFVLYPLYNRHEVMTLLIKQKIELFKNGHIFTPIWKTKLEHKYKKEIQMIHERMSDHEIVILSSDDTYLFYLTGYENMMNDNSQITILTDRDMIESLKKVDAICPKKIVTDCSLFKKCNPDPFSVAASFSIQPLLLEHIQKACNSIYSSIICTDQLCIAQAKQNK